MDIEEWADILALIAVMLYGAFRLVKIVCRRYLK